MQLSLANKSVASRIKLAAAALLLALALIGAPQAGFIGDFIQGMLFSGAVELMLFAYCFVFFGLMALYREEGNIFLKRDYPWVVSALAFLKPLFETAFYFVFSYFAFYILMLIIVILMKSLGLGILPYGSLFFWLALYLLVEVFSGLGERMEGAFLLKSP